MYSIVIAWLILHQIDHDENLGHESRISHLKFNFSSKSLILHMTPILISRNVSSTGHALKKSFFVEKSLESDSKHERGIDLLISPL